MRLTRIVPLSALVVAGALAAGQTGLASDLAPADLLKPLGASWTSYSGDYTGKRYSSLAQVNQTTVTRKSSRRARRPASFSPEASVTVAVTGLVAGGGPARRAPRGRATPPDTHMFWRAIGLAARVAMPWRSPVGEWQLAHWAAKNA